MKQNIKQSQQQPQQQSPATSAMQPLRLNNLVPVNLMNQQQAFTGHVFISQQVHQALLNVVQNLQPNVPAHQQAVYLKINGFLFTASSSQNYDNQQIGLGKIPRQLLRISLNESVMADQYIPPLDQETNLISLNLEIEAAQLNQGRLEAEEAQIEKIVREQFKNMYMQPGHIFIFDFFGNTLTMKVTSTALMDMGMIAKSQSNSLENKPGFICSETEISMSGHNTPQFKLLSKTPKEKTIFDHNFTMDQLGVGGLDDQLITIFRRAFASRRYPPQVLQKYGIAHVKGVLLHGPPGTGKTLIARKLAKVLKAKEPKIVNGPEIMSKYVGQAEENIRKLFEEAIQDQKTLGDESELHIIIFDELDSICRQRGTINSGTGVHDTMVNQLLSMIDGVDALNNVLVIGMTNRKDLIDEAILRPGRFEVHVEISLPNEAGRLQIFKIHTAKIVENKLIGKDVNLDELAKMTKNYTGAEIEAVVKSAASFSFNRGHELFNFDKKSLTTLDCLVERQDFMEALKEVKPQFGVDIDRLKVLTRNQLYEYGESFSKIMNVLQQSVQQVMSGQSSQLHSVLLEGPPGTGKTAIAAHAALRCNFPFIKLISAENFVGYTENGKINQILKIFEDAYKSPQACVLIDNIERIIEFIDAGPRFSNPILQALLVLIKKLPNNPENKLLIIATTSSASTLKDLEIIHCFNLIINVPMLKNSNDIASVLVQYTKSKNTQNPQEIAKIAQSVSEIPIKKLILVCDMATKGQSDIHYEEFMRCYQAAKNSDLY